MQKILAIGLACSLLAACGGDDTPAPPTTTPPPVFGNASYDINYAENGTAPVITLTVTDPGGNLVLSLSGPDRSLFSLQNGRDLVFATPPDFETPRDQGANNVYDVTVTATDAQGRSSSVAVKVTVTNTIGALRFVDPVFASTTSLGNVSVPGAAGVVSVSLLGPLGDPLAQRPLVLVGGDGASTSALTSLAEGLAQRGYVVGIVGQASAADLLAVAQGFATGSFPGAGIDPLLIGVAGVGDEAYRAAIDSALAGTDFAVTGADGTSANAQQPAAQLYAQFVEGSQ